MFLKIRVCCFALLMFFSTVGGASITINPSSMVVGSSSANPVTRVEVLCNSDGVNNIEAVYRLEISRRRFSESNFVNIAGVDAYKITKSFPADMKSPNATGSLVSVAAGEPPTSGTLVVTMDGGGLTCSDQAEFKCSMTYKMMGVESTPASSNSDNFTVITAPNDVQIMDALYEENGIQLQLANDARLNVGTRIKYRCTANIGSDSSVLISWERSPVMGTSTDLVPYIPAESTDIVQDPVVSTSCSNTRTSSMYYNMTNSDDDGVTFRCKVRSYLSGNWYESISTPRRTFTVRTAGTGGGNASGSSGSTAQGGVIAGAVIGAIAGVVLLIVLVYFLWYRKRSSGESYRTKEEGERPEPPPTDYTYATADKKKRTNLGTKVGDSDGRIPPGSSELHYAELELSKEPRPTPRKSKAKDPPVEYTEIRFNN